MGRGRYLYQEVLPLAAMVAVEFTSVGQSTLFITAFSKGLSYHIFMKNSAASIYYFPSWKVFPPWVSWVYGSTVGVSRHHIQQSDDGLGHEQSHPRFYLCPCRSFQDGKAKAEQYKQPGQNHRRLDVNIRVLYSGPILISGHSQKLTLTNVESDWILGGALLAGCYVLSSFWYIFQAKYVKEYPSEFVVVFFYSFFAFLISVLVGIASEPYLSSWKVPADIRLLSILYSGIIGTGFAITVHTWGLHVKGPVYVALFKPLSIAIAAMLGVIFLSDDLYLGSVIGSVVITVGFYNVMWGKTKEEITESSQEADDSESSRNDEIAPLLKH